jgi:hypothetical protein
MPKAPHENRDGEDTECKISLLADAFQQNRYEKEERNGGH